jgi:hypothetical protein
MGERNDNRCEEASHPCAIKHPQHGANGIGDDRLVWMYGFDHFMDVLSPFLWRWMLVYSTVIVAIGQSLWNQGFRISSIATASLIGSFAQFA